MTEDLLPLTLVEGKPDGWLEYKPREWEDVQGQQDLIEGSLEMSGRFGCYYGPYNHKAAAEEWAMLVKVRACVRLKLRLVSIVGYLFTEM